MTGVAAETDGSDESLNQELFSFFDKNSGAELLINLCQSPINPKSGL